MKEEFALISPYDQPANTGVNELFAVLPNEQQEPFDQATRQFRPWLCAGLLCPSSFKYLENCMKKGLFPHFEVNTLGDMNEFVDMKVLIDRDCEELLEMGFRDRFA